MRGRQTMAILRLAGLDELIALNRSDYVEKALAVASEGFDRDRIVTAMGGVTEDDRPLAAITELVADFLSRATPRGIQTP